MTTRPKLRIIAAFVSCGLSTGALAGEWEMIPTVQSGVSYNDNPALEPQSRIRGQDRATTYLFALAEADFVKAEPSYAVTISPRIRRLEYPEREFERLSRTDYYLRGDITKAAQLYTMSLSATYDKLNVLSAEDYSGDIDDDGGTGDFSNLDDTRERYTLSPAFNWSPTQKDSVSLAAAYNVTDHEVERTPRARADIDFTSVSLQYLRAVSPRTSIGALATYADSDSERLLVGTTANTDTETKTINLSARYQWSEQTRLDFNIGEQETTSVSNVVDTASGTTLFALDNGFDGRNYSINLTTTGPRYRIELRASRGASNQSDGTPSDNTELRGFIVYRLTPKLVFRFEASGSERTQQNEARRSEVLFYRTDTSLTWRLTEKLNLVGTYIYRDRDPEITPEPANPAENEVRKSNAFIGSFIYRF